MIDDGGHTAAQQVASFEALFPGLRPRGAYVVEDTHTSYWPAFGGGWPGVGGAPDAGLGFVAYAKRLLDVLHAWHAPPEAAAALPEREWAFARAARSVAVYSSVVVVEKRARALDAADLAPAFFGETPLGEALPVVRPDDDGVAWPDPW